MARMKPYSDPVLDRIKRKFSLRLEKARREGRLWEEMKAIEREGMAVYRRSMNGYRKRRAR